MDDGEKLCPVSTNKPLIGSVSPGRFLRVDRSRSFDGELRKVIPPVLQIRRGNRDNFPFLFFHQNIH